MDRADLVIHVIELVVALIIIPSVKQLVSILVGLNQTVALLGERLAQHSVAFNQHVSEDREQFKEIREQIERRRWPRQ